MIAAPPQTLKNREISKGDPEAPSVRPGGSATAGQAESPPRNIHSVGQSRGAVFVISSIKLIAAKLLFIHSWQELSQILLL